MRRIASLSILPIALIAHAAAAQGVTPPDAPAATTPDTSSEILDIRTARAMGLRSLWQAKLPMGAATGWCGLSLNHGAAENGSRPLTEVSVWDEAGVMLCVDGSTGAIRWQKQPTGTPQGYRSVNRATIEGRDLLVAIGENRMIAIDRISGEVAGLSPYAHNPRTAAVVMGNLMAFGSSGRNLSVMRVFEEDVPKRGHERLAPGRITGLPAQTTARKQIVSNEVRSIGLKGRPSAAPVVVGRDLLLQSSEDGEVCLVDPASGHKSWTIRVPGKIRTGAAVVNRVAFVGADDQYLRCVNLESGKVRWKWFAPGPVERPILATEDLVFTQVPGGGLVALKSGISDQAGNGSIEGEVLWKSEAIAGDPITVLRGGLLVWNAESRTLSLVDLANGKLRQAVRLPAVTSISCSAPVDGDLVMIEQGGRLQRCSAADPTPPKPVAKPAEPSPSEAPAATTDAAGNAESAPAEQGG